mgnify:CR=1 FL=1
MDNFTSSDVGEYRVPEKCLFGHPIPRYDVAIVEGKIPHSPNLPKRRYAYHMCGSCSIGGIQGRVSIIDMSSGKCIRPTLATLWWIEWSTTRIAASIYASHMNDENYTDQEKMILEQSQHLSLLCRKQAEELLFEDGFLYPVAKVGDHAVIAFTPYPTKKNVGLN